MRENGPRQEEFARGKKRSAGHILPITHKPGERLLLSNNEQPEYQSYSPVLQRKLPGMQNISTHCPQPDPITMQETMNRQQIIFNTDNAATNGLSVLFSPYSMGNPIIFFQHTFHRK
jgi:hypothetical protein